MNDLDTEEVSAKLALPDLSWAAEAKRISNAPTTLRGLFRGEHRRPANLRMGIGRTGLPASSARDARVSTVESTKS